MYPKGNGSPSDAAEVNSSPHFPSLEREVLEFWDADETFQASIDQREGSPEWVFYDGPPFANGLPHYGHLLTGYAKDVFPRFQTMRGKLVHRRFGWDTHGLPAELEAERQLGITDKSQIEKMGIAAFNEVARESVLRYTREWQESVTRQARWVDFDNDYKTLEPEYMESVMWAFKRLHDKGLVYEGHRVLPYCWRDQTPLSNHELRMDDDVYRSRQDPSVTVTFPLCGERADKLGITGVRVIVWTTTPWTLPTNLALAVGPDIDYVIVPAGPNGASDNDTASDSASYLVAGPRLASYAKDLGYDDPESASAAIVRIVRGSDLAGVSYERLWDYFADTDTWGTAQAWQILADDYVSTEDGTGIVHLAPAFGEDDHRICQAADIPLLLSVGEGGRFLPMIDEVAGMTIFDANRPLIRAVRARGRLLREASYEHSYPHCWRCRNPLIYRAVSSWFVKVPDIRDRMIELNADINWVPHNVGEGQFGAWISNARDWSVSRNRFWGSPIPVWKSDDPDYPRVDVYGSLDELERDFGVRPSDLHRPAIDELTRPNPDDPTGRSTMRRVTDVLDVWFDSGSMPFAQVHFPFENEEWFTTHNPADFIVEYIGQTRGWFYTLHALSTALFDRPAFRNAVSHGIVLGSDGQKMSKSLRNYPDVNEVFDREGSDAMRWFLMASSVLRGGNLVVTEEGIREAARQVLFPLWSTWYFFSLYANTCNYEAESRTDSTHVLDRYILSKTHQLIDDVTEHLEAFDTPLACAAIHDFVDVLTNWYVRRSRDRFWHGVDASGENRAAFDTLFTVLEVLCRVTAPLLPLVTERIWQGLSGERSVHLTDWPKPSDFPFDSDLVATMDVVRSASSVGLSLRKKAGLRVRLPLSRMTVVTTNASALENFSAILRDELNVRVVQLTELTETAIAECGMTYRLTINARVLGPRLGKDVQRVIQAARVGEWSESTGVITVGGFELQAGEYEQVLEVAQGDDATRAVAPLPHAGFVILETTVTEELEREGRARDTIRDVQEARRSAKLHVSDRIELRFSGDPEFIDVIKDFAEMIATETLALSIEGRASGEAFATEWPDAFTVPLKTGFDREGSNGSLSLRRVASAEVTQQ